MNEGGEFFYNTIATIATAEFRDRGSRFIAYALPLDSIESFKSELQQLRKEHPKAVHHCFAYRIGADKLTFRASDDGEPAGSAGRPILGQIDSNNLTNIAVIVVRYFGGTLLGIPGLINAYKTVTGEALEVAEKITRPVTDKYNLQFDYTKMNDVLRLLRQHHASIDRQELQLFCSVDAAFQRQNKAVLLEKLKELQDVEVRPV